jgi:hypothetical protein
MLTVFIALALLAGAVGAIYALLRNMGEDGIEVAAPGSCKSGQCGVRKGGACGQEDSDFAGDLALDGVEEQNGTVEPQPQRRLG